MDRQLVPIVIVLSALAMVIVLFLCCVCFAVARQRDFNVVRTCQVWWTCGCCDDTVHVVPVQMLDAALPVASPTILSVGHDEGEEHGDENNHHYNNMTSDTET